MKSEKEPKRETQLRADAPVFVPLITLAENAFILPPQLHKEAQCSRYSRKSVWRMEENSNSPRPILGSKNHLPRPILGRKENIQPANEDDYMGKQFKSIYRRMLRMKISDENRKKHDPKPKVKS